MVTTFRYKLQIAEEKEIELISIHQKQTYENLLNGPPNKRIDSFLLQDVEKLAARLYPRINHVKIPYQNEDEQDTYVRIPPVTCIARFRANWLSTEEGYYVIVYSWYQNDFAFPIEETIESYIRAQEIENLGTIFGL